MQHAENFSADTELDKIFNNSSTGESDTLPKFLLIEGNPGIGKTVVAMEIASRWAYNRMFSNIKLLLLIYFRQIDFNTITSFESLMQHCYVEDKKEASNCAKHFSKTQGKDLMLIFDGYDEMASEDQKKSDTFFMKLLKGYYLPDCNIVVTSRPNITVHLHQYCDCRAEILGFTKDDRLSYFKKNLLPENFNKVTEFLQNNVFIDSLCYIPINLVNFLSLAEYNDIQLPKTQTELTGNTIRLTIARNKSKLTNKILDVSVFRDKEIDKTFTSLASFAYQMLDIEKLMFSEDEMKSAGIDLEGNNNKYGLLKAVQLYDIPNGQRKTVYSFVHFSVQEYLAAYHLSNMGIIKQVRSLDKIFFNGKYFGVLRMYTGLTKGNNFPLKCYLSGKKYTATVMHHWFGLKFPGITEDLKSDKVRCLQLYLMFLEAPENEMKESFSTIIKNDTINLNGEYLSSNNMTILSYIIARSHITHEWHTISLSNCSIDDDTLKSFYQVQVLCAEDSRKKPVITNLDVSKNNISELDTIINLFTKCKIIHFNASDNFAAPTFSKLKVDCCQELEILNLSNNLLDSEVVCRLYHVIVKCENLAELYLNNNYIDEHAISSLVKCIVQLDSLKTFECEGNAFSNSEITSSLFKFAISHHLKFNNEEMKTLNFTDSEVIEREIKHFISVLDCIRDIPALNSKYIGCISQLHEISLKCHPSEGICLTRNASVFFETHCFKHLIALNLSGLRIDEESASYILKALGNNLKWECLQMNNCELTSKVADLIASKISDSKFKGIKVLQLCNNNMDDEAIEALSIATLHCDLFECIETDNNRFSTQGIMLLEILTNPKGQYFHIDFTNNYYVIKSFIWVLEHVSKVSNKPGKHIKHFTDNILKVKKLLLQIQQPIEMTSCASNTFQRLNNINILNVSGIIFSDKTLDKFCNFLLKNQKKLKCLIMNNCKLNSTKILKFVDKLKLATEINEVQFCNNAIDDDATEPLVIAISHWNKLQILEIEGNRFTQRSIQIFTAVKELLKSSSSCIQFNGKIEKIISFIDLLGYMMNVDITKSVMVKKISKSKRILLNYLEQNNTTVQFKVSASKFFVKFINLTELNISGIMINKEVADNLANAFDGNLHCLVHLIMNNCQLTSPIVFSLIKKLPNCKNMREIQLCNNLLNDEVAEELVLSILHLNELQILKLEQNSFSNKYEKVLYMLTKYLNFSGLMIKYNDGVDSIVAFFTLLEHMQSISLNVSNFVDNVSKIETLSLDCSKQNTADEEIELTAKASQFFQRFKLIKLNLSGIIIKQVLIDNILPAFGADLRLLYLNNCDLNSTTVIKLMQKLQKAKHIKTFELCDNHISDEATESLVKAILHWNSADHIKLENNNFSEKGIKLFAFLIKFSKFSDKFINFNDKVDAIIPFITLLGYMVEVDIQDSVLVKNVSKVTKLLINCSEQNNTNVQFKVSASKFLTRFSNLTELNISGIVISKEVAGNLANAFDGNLNSLEHLIMNKCCLTSSIALMLIKKLPSCVNMREFQLCNNFIDDTVAEKLVVSILHLNVLETLKVEQNSFNKKHQKVFSFLMKNLKFSSLEINDTDSIIAFITLLECMEDISIGASNFVNRVSEVDQLSLQNTIDKPLELTIKASQFFQKFQLTKLNLTGILIKGAVIDNILKAFGAKLQLLEGLLMNKCNLNSKIIIKLLNQLQNAKNIKELQLCNNNIDDEATEAMALAILHWNLLECIKIENNKFSNESKILLNMLIEEAKPNLIIDFRNMDYAIKSFLKVIDYTNINSYTNEGATQFLNNLLKITKLSLGVKTSLEMTSEALIALTRLRNLNLLNLSGIIITEQVASKFCGLFDSNHRCLKHLIMNDCKLNSSKILKFVDKLKLTVEMREAQLCNNTIDDDATEPLVIAIVHWNELQILKLEHNLFTQRSMQVFAIVKGISESSCSHIEFNGKIEKIISFVDLLGYMMNVDIIKSALMIKISKVETLLLDCSEQNDTNIQFTARASKFFTRFVNLTELNISGIMITKVVADNLASAFDSNLCSLEHLIMNNCQLTSSIALMLIIKLPSCVNMKELQLCNNLIDDEVAKTLIVSILHLNKLQMLKLEQNCFEKYKKVLYFQSKHLNFSDSVINFNDEIDNIFAFVNLLDYMDNVSVNLSNFVDNVAKINILSLDCSRENTEDIELELTAERSKFFKRFNLTKLNLSGIVIKEIIVINNLFGTDLQSLQCLFLNKCNLNSTLVKALMQKLQNVKNLKEIELCNNDIDDDATDTLVNSILHWNFLKCIKLDNNQLAEKNIQVFEVLNELLNSPFNGKVDKVNPFITVLGYMENVRDSVLSQNVMKTKELLLDCTEQNDIKVWCPDNAFTFITRFVNLTKLNISGIPISKRVAEDYLTKVLDKNSNFLECLLMNKCQLTSSIIKTVMKKIHRCSKLRELQLSNNKIGDEVTNTLITSILQLNALEILNLEQNCFTDRYKKVFYFLASKLKFSDSRINFSNDLDHIIALLTLLEHVKDLKELSNFVDNVSNVNSLNLDCSKKNVAIHKIQLSVKASHFFQHFHLTELNLGGIIIEEVVIDNLLRVDLECLKCLYMNNCSLNSTTVIKLLDKLKNAKNINELQLSCNNIDDKVTTALALAILNWNSFQILKVDNTKLSEGNKLLLNLLTYDFQHVSIDFGNKYYTIKIFINVLLYYIDHNINKRSSQFTRNISRATTLLLNYNQKQQQPLSFHKSPFFLNFINLKVLDISGIIINEEVCGILNDAFGSNLHSLHHLIMNKCCLNTKMFESFVMQLKGNQCLKELQWCDNDIGDKAIESTVIGILSWNSLEHIAYSKEKFSSKCVMLLDLLVKSIMPTLIDLSNDFYSIKSFLSVLHCVNESTSNKVASFNENISKVTELSLECSQVNKTIELSCEAVAVLKNFMSLTKLDFSGIIIAEDKIDRVVPVFQTYLQKLQSLFMNNCQLSSISVCRCVQALRHKNIKEIKLCNNLIDDEATEALAVAILNWNSPKFKLQGNVFSNISQMQLNLLKNKITNTCCHNFVINDNANIKSFLAIMKCISNRKVYVKNRIDVSKISHLSLTYCSEERMELSNASKSFKYFKSISELEISGVIINKQAARIISQALSTNYATKLKVLKLNFCWLSSHSAVILLSLHNENAAKLILNNLIHLDFSNNCIEDNATQALIKALLQMPNLKSINFDGNKFKHQRMNVITDFILKFKELQSPVLKFQDYNHIATFLIILSCAKNIPNNTSSQVSNFVELEELNLQCEDIDKSIVFTKNSSLSFKLLTKLRTLKLNGICFTSKKAITIFADCLGQCFPSLQELRLNNCKLDSSSARKLFSCEKGLPIAFKQLKILDISNNYLKDESDVVNLMVRCLLQMPNLIICNTEGNEIGNFLAVIFSIILDLRKAKPSLTYQNSIEVVKPDKITAFFAILSSVKEISEKMPCQVDNMTNIKRLVLQNDKYILNVTDNVFHFFERFSTLHELSLSGIYINEGVASVISIAVSNNLKCLHELKLINCQLNSNSIIILLPSSKTPVPVAYKVLKEIDLSSNNICDEAIIPLFASILQMCPLERLNIDNNKFGKYNIDKIFQIVLENKNEAKKQFRNKEDSVLYITSFLTFLSSAKFVSSEASQQVKSLMKITHLSLECTEVSSQCMLSEEPSLFFKKFSLLKTLSLHGIKIQPEAVMVIAKALDSNLLLLEVLKLSACGIDSESAIEIISALKKDSIKTLCLSGNAIDCKAAKVISDFVSNNNILTEINMAQNTLATKGTITLIEGLGSCTNLVELDLSYNNITDDATESLVKLIRQIIKQSPSIKINNNKLSQQSVGSIKSVMSWMMWFKCEI